MLWLPRSPWPFSLKMLPEEEVRRESGQDANVVADPGAKRLCQATFAYKGNQKILQWQVRSLRPVFFAQQF